jgi:predicted ATPase
MAFFSKTNVMIKFFPNLAFALSQKRHFADFLAKIFLKS